MLICTRTMLYYVADSVHLAVKNIAFFNILQDALKDLRLVLNAVKTKYILFSKARAIDYTDLIFLLQMDLELRVKDSYHGIWIDEKKKRNFTLIILCSDSCKSWLFIQK